MKKITHPALLLALGATVSMAAWMPKTTEFLFPNLDTESVQSDSTKKDSLKSYPKFKDLPLKPEREVSFTTAEGTWMSLDVSPDGKTIAFDLGQSHAIHLRYGLRNPPTLFPRWQQTLVYL